MKVVKYQLLLAAALLAGVAIGFFAGESAPEAKPADAEKPVRKTVISDKGDEATIASLRRRVAELEKLLAAGKEEKSGEAATNVVAVAAARPEQPRNWWNPREMLENLKKTDPERYVQTTNSMARWRQRRADRAQSTLGFLASVDTSRMGAAARKTHENLQELVARRAEIEEQLHQLDLSDEDRGQLMDELRQTHHELMRLNGEERKILFDEAARNLGFEGQEVKEFTAAIQEVIDATDGGWGPGRHRGPRGPGGPGGR